MIIITKKTLTHNGEYASLKLNDEIQLYHNNNNNNDFFQLN